MKFLVSPLLAGALILGAQTIHAQGGADINTGQAPVGLFGHTPSPTPPKAVSGPKKPLSITLAKDEKGGGAGTVFAKTDSKVYLLCKDVSGNKGDKVQVVWIAEDTGGTFAKNKKLSEFTQTLTGPGQPSTFYQPAPGGGFPPGKYRADLYENSKLAKSLKFTVKK